MAVSSSGVSEPVEISVGKVSREVPQRGARRRDYQALEGRIVPIVVDLQQSKTADGWHVGVRLVRRSR
jgi:hypothetical protein